ncbi:MAG TPA: hypothetical protein VIX35_07455, partial [Vicinamibacterales bacterium]
NTQIITAQKIQTYGLLSARLVISMRRSNRDSLSPHLATALKGDRAGSFSIRMNDPSSRSPRQPEERPSETLHV